MRWFIITMFSILMFAILLAGGVYLMRDNPTVKSLFLDSEYLDPLFQNAILFNKFNNSNQLLANFLSPSPSQSSFNPSSSYTLNYTTFSNQTNTTYAFLNDSLIGWWRLDNDGSVGENDSRVVDWSGNNYNGTVLSGATANTSGAFGGSYNFDGVGYVNTSYTTAIGLGEFAYSLWFKTNITQITGLLTKRVGGLDQFQQFTIIMGGDSLGGSPGGLIAFNDVESALGTIRSNATPINYNDNNWHHVLLQRNSTTDLMYLDGVLAATASSVDVNLVNTPSLVIGGLGDSGGALPSYGFNGYIDEVLVYNRMLTAEEIKGLYNSSTYSTVRSFTNKNSIQNYSLFTVDKQGNMNSTSLGFIANSTQDNFVPRMTFVSPTPAEGTTTATALVNVSTTDDEKNQTYSFFNDSLLAWWRFDNNQTVGENASRIFDWTNHQLNGTIVNGSMVTIPGAFGGAYNFNGLNQYVTFGNVAYLNSSFTLSTWVRTDTVPQTNPIILGKTASTETVAQYPQNYMLFVRTDYAGADIWSFETNFDCSPSCSITEITGSPVVVNEWTQLSSVWDTTQNKVFLYINGELYNSTTIVSGLPMNEPNLNLTIGAYDSGVGGYFNGSIDETLIFNRTLSASEIRGLYNSSQYVLTRNITVVGNNFTVNVKAVDSGGNLATTQRTFSNTTVGPSDTIYPIFYNFTSGIVNNTVYSLGQKYGFNVTINNTNGTAGLQFNNINYSLGNVSRVFNATVSNLGAGTYSYYWWSYGNGTLGNYNTSGVLSYTVSNGTLSGALLINGSASNKELIYPSQVNASATNMTGNLNLTRNGIDINGLNHIFQSLTVGFYQYNATLSLNANYSNSIISYYVNISKGSSTIFTYISGTRSNKNANNGTILLLNSSLVTGQFGRLNLTVNGVQVNTSITNDISALYNFSTVGVFTIRSNYTGNVNYSNSHEDWTVTVTQPGPPSNTTTISVGICPWKKFGYYTTELPWFRQENCI